MTVMAMKRTLQDAAQAVGGKGGGRPNMAQAGGKDAAKLTHTLASRRADKPNPLYYAQRTVDMASARLWLMEGTSIANVIAMLESRRQPEIPAALCSARAREIAATAQRMIARNKVA